MKARLLLTLLVVTSLSVTARAVPNAPQNLRVSISGTTVALDWDAPAGGSGPAEYVIEAALSAGGPAIASFAVVSTTKFFTDVPHGTYYVRVRALDATGSSAPTDEVAVVVPSTRGCTDAPPAPAALIDNTTGNVVRLSWTAPSARCGVASYRLHAGSFPGASNLGVFDAGEATTFAASAPTGTYHVRVVATNAFGIASAPSNEVVVRPGIGCPRTPTPPSQPWGLTATATGGVVTLNWRAPSYSCHMTSYIVHVGSAPGLSDVAVADVGIVNSLSTPAPVGRYYVRVFATGEGGTSDASNEKGFVIASGSVTVGFHGVSSLTGTPLVGFGEAGFTIMLAGANWTAWGDSIVFGQQSQETDTTGELTITSEGRLFTFAAIDIYASITHVPFEIVGLRSGTAVYTAGGTLPNPHGNFLTVMNPHPSVSVDAVVIRVTHPPTPQLTCPRPAGQCLSPAGVDNIVLVR